MDVCLRLTREEVLLSGDLFLSFCRKNMAGLHGIWPAKKPVQDFHTDPRREPSHDH